MTSNTPYVPPSQQLLYPPTPQEYADALEQLNKGAQTQIRTPGALGSDLLAEALLQYGRNRAARQQPASMAPNLSPTLAGGDPGAGPGYSTAAGWPLS